jgi:dynein heavy chain
MRLNLFETLLKMDKPEGEFVQWRAMIPAFVYEPSASFFDLFVPNKDTVCYSTMFENFLQMQAPMYFTGITGSGKTMIIKNCIAQQRQAIASITLNFSAKSKSRDTQLQIESKMQHQRRMGRALLMAPPGKACTLLFIDDVNMPLTELYGAQPPIELLKTILCYRGVFDRNTKDWKDIENLWMVAAASPAGGGRSELTPSFYRHFTVFCLPEGGEESINLIFSSIMEGYLSTHEFRETIVDLVRNKKPLIASST